MLVVYTTRETKPVGCLDVSTVALDDLAATVEDICRHQTTGHIWLGYLDGWMLSPTDEVRLRPALRKFTCSLITLFPLALPLAWKNEIQTLYTVSPNGHSNSDNNGRAVHDGSATRHRHFGPNASSDRVNHQD